MTISSAKSAPSAKSAIPYVIIGAFVLFALYIGVMVQQAMRTDVQLVSADYYQQELGYQERITAEGRTAALPTPVRITEGADQLTIQLPPALAGQAIAGQVRFFRPSDSRLDFSVPLRSTTLTQTLSTAKLKAGHWRVQLDFTANGQRYFVEQVIRR
jgi:nitrogen fixation protein FixH